MKNLLLLADHPEFSGSRILVESVLREIEALVAALPCARNFRPVLRAARDGVLTRDPNEVYFYLYGAIHASSMDNETWEMVDLQLDRLRN